MKIEEALKWAEEWTGGQTFHEHSQGWRIVCATLAAEVRKYQRCEIICAKCGLMQGSNNEEPNF